jgi:hypothetical protein
MLLSLITLVWQRVKSSNFSKPANAQSMAKAANTTPKTPPMLAPVGAARPFAVVEAPVASAASICQTVHIQLENLLVELNVLVPVAVAAELAGVCPAVVYCPPGAAVPVRMM